MDNNNRFSTTVSFAQRIWQFEIIDLTTDNVSIPTSTSNWLIVTLVFVIVMIITIAYFVQKFW